MKKIANFFSCLNKKTLLLAIALIVLVAAMFFGGLTQLSNGSKNAAIQTPEISAEIGDKVNASSVRVKAFVRTYNADGTYTDSSTAGVACGTIKAYAEYASGTTVLSGSGEAVFDMQAGSFGALGKLCGLVAEQTGNYYYLGCSSTEYTTIARNHFKYSGTAGNQEFESDLSWGTEGKKGAYVDKGTLVNFDINFYFAAPITVNLVVSNPEYGSWRDANSLSGASRASITLPYNSTYTVSSNSITFTNSLTGETTTSYAVLNSSQNDFISISSTSGTITKPTTICANMDTKAGSVYLNQAWYNKLTNNNTSVISKDNVKSIIFTNVIPSGATYLNVNVSSYPSDLTTNPVKCGFEEWTIDTGYDSISVYSNVEDNLYTIYFYSPSTIYAPNNCASLFENFTALENIDFSNFNTNYATTFSNMFNGCEELEFLDLQNFNTNKVITMECMFKTCKSLINVDVSGFDTSAVTNMAGMFYGCNSLINLDLCMFNVNHVSNMMYMFYMCNSLEEIMLWQTETTSLANMSFMFAYCYNLEAIDMSCFNTVMVEDMSYAFLNCEKLTSANMFGWNTCSVESFEGMFMGCSALQTINLSSFSFDAITADENVFGMLGVNDAMIIDFLSDCGETAFSLLATYSNAIINNNTSKKIQVLQSILKDFCAMSETNAAKTAENLYNTNIQTIYAPENVNNLLIALPYNNNNVYVYDNGTGEQETTFLVGKNGLSELTIAPKQAQSNQPENPGENQNPGSGTTQPDGGNTNPGDGNANTGNQNTNNGDKAPISTEMIIIIVLSVVCASLLTALLCVIFIRGKQKDEETPVEETTGSEN